MPVNVVQWCVEIGFLTRYVMLDTQQNFLFQVTRLPKKQQLLSGDIVLNPGPNKTNSSCKFSVCHWNLNSLAAHNF